MKIIIDINTENAAFENGGEVKRIIDEVYRKIKAGLTYGRIMDVNGNSCGKFEVTP